MISAMLLAAVASISSAFENAGKWEETGDVAQMTPFGFIITGRKRHLFVTLGGTVVSPVRLEQLLKEDEIKKQLLLKLILFMIDNYRKYNELIINLLQ